MLLYYLNDPPFTEEMSIDIPFKANVCILILISLRFVPTDLNDDKAALV